jgi:hypothetical protein
MGVVFLLNEFDSDQPEVFGTSSAVATRLYSWLEYVYNNEGGPAGFPWSDVETFGDGAMVCGRLVSVLDALSADSGPMPINEIGSVQVSKHTVY